MSQPRNRTDGAPATCSRARPALALSPRCRQSQAPSGAGLRCVSCLASTTIRAENLPSRQGWIDQGLTPWTPGPEHDVADLAHAAAIGLRDAGVVGAAVPISKEGVARPLKVRAL